MNGLAAPVRIRSSKRCPTPAREDAGRSIPSRLRSCCRHFWILERTNRVRTPARRRASIRTHMLVGMWAPGTGDASTSTIDVYCLSCGYNLRGLSGDPCRCPECAHLNPIGDLLVPAGVISRYLRALETWPAVGAGAALLGLPALAGWILLSTRLFGFGGRGMPHVLLV